MSKFKRVSLAGSEELFRPTRPKLVDSDDIVTEIVEHSAVERQEKVYRTVHLTAEEIELLLDGIQAARFPERAPKPSLDKFERLQELRNKLQDEPPA